MYRFIKEDQLRRVLKQALPPGQTRDAALAAVDRFLARQPRHPRLVGSTAAAKILGIRTPHISRMREQGRMPDSIEVEGSVEVYVRDEVEELGRELHGEREARAARRAEKETKAA